MTGMIQGGWEYVYVVYGFTWLCILGYTASLIFRGRTS